MVDNDIDKQDLLKFKESLSPYEQDLLYTLPEHLHYEYLKVLKHDKIISARRMKNLGGLRPIHVRLNEGGY